MQFGLILSSTELSNDVAHAIQLALAPVFLLTGIAGMLNVMTGRLSRIIDRGRQLTESAAHAAILPPDRLAVELATLERRRQLSSNAIAACTLAALLVCMVIVLLFLEVLFNLPLKWLEGMFFAGSTIALVAGLAFFLFEVHMATHTVKIDLREGVANDSTASHSSK